ncbi:SET domain-containing protein-lysine N-methyltransferase [Lichenibacterium ramalinae]|uniref:SET domain-containing protein-lysine N-methyltransferase n=1 Tax=Lichenibacterium ramalinae TaxID=2316527 RepID=A0A4Q2R7F9_9HYPH|nr:SET domain-containing protein [Lichenibacterium ramalinae]RYB02567.1 SET domain-containing protein-lysine N-methyltransferase [Lichenibacterium ramalinae]
MTSAPGPLPHDGLYTRLGVSPGLGVGVFALRDIPQGTNPFRGETAALARIPAATVEAIADPAARRMYLDFCPLVDGHFLAPSSFNAMTVSWYMNHSDRPNIACDPDLNFLAARPIRAGEELTVDYRTFSDHAGHFVDLWNTGAD